MLTWTWTASSRECVHPGLEGGVLLPLHAPTHHLTCCATDSSCGCTRALGWHCPPPPPPTETIDQALQLVPRR